MIEDYSDRLAAAMAHAGLTVSRMASLLGVSYQAVKKVLDGKSRSLTAENNARAAEICGVGASWLATGVGYMLDVKTSPKKNNGSKAHLSLQDDDVEGAPSLVNSRRVPVVGEVKGGPDGFLEELVYPVGMGDGFVEYWCRDEQAFALRVRGDSMHPRYRAGEFVVVTPSIEAQPGSDVVVQLADGRKLLKLLNWVRDDEIQLLSINNGYQPLTVRKSDVVSIQLVVGGVGRHAFIGI